MSSATQVQQRAKHTSTWRWHGLSSEVLFARYRDFHARVVRQEAPSKDRQYLVVAAVAGLGNKMQAMVSGYLLALLTQRVLIIQWDAGPVGLSDLFESPGIVWNMNDVKVLRHMGGHDAAHFLGKALRVSLMLDVHPAGVPAYVSGLKPSENSTMDSFLCSDLREQWSQHSVVKLVTFYNLVPFLAVNPHFRPDLEAAFGSTTRIFPVLARELLRPSTAVRLKLQPLPAHVIAMHVRTQFDSRPSQQMPLNFEATFFSCAQEIVASN